VLIDDSIVRGNTIGPIIKLLRDAGAKEVHIRIASPPIKYPCYMGINIPTREELIANKLDAHQLAEAVGADSLVYLSIEGLISAITYAIREKDQKKSWPLCGLPFRSIPGETWVVTPSNPNVQSRCSRYNCEKKNSNWLVL